LRLFKIDINQNDKRMKNKSITVVDVYNHFSQRELSTETFRRTYSTRKEYEGYLNKWVIPHWGERPLASIRAGEGELWMRSLPVTRSTCVIIRNVMSVLFNHAIRHGLCGMNPIRLVRQSAQMQAMLA
jgi:integrase